MFIFRHFSFLLSLLLQNNHSSIYRKFIYSTCILPKKDNTCDILTWQAISRLKSFSQISFGSLTLPTGWHNACCLVEECAFCQVNLLDFTQTRPNKKGKFGSWDIKIYENNRISIVLVTTKSVISNIGLFPNQGRQKKTFWQ